MVGPDTASACLHGHPVQVCCGFCSPLPATEDAGPPGQVFVQRQAPTHPARSHKSRVSLYLFAPTETVILETFASECLPELQGRRARLQNRLAWCRPFQLAEWSQNTTFAAR